MKTKDETITEGLIFPDDLEFELESDYKCDEQGRCPICKKYELEYDYQTFYDDEVFWEYECKNCKTLGKEIYHLNFVGHYEVRKNK